MPERSSYARRRCTAICGVSSTKNHRGKKPVGGKKNSEENLKKDSPYVLLVLPGDEDLHSFSPQVVVKLVHVQEGLVRFPSIA